MHAAGWFQADLLRGRGHRSYAINDIDVTAERLAAMSISGKPCTGRAERGGLLVAGMYPSFRAGLHASVLPWMIAAVERGRWARELRGAGRMRLPGAER
jgi:hypothetical protein